MKVLAVMNPKPHSLRPHDLLSEAARVMWDRDCGWVPVLDDSNRVVGVITDRDVCMAAFTRGMTLTQMVVEGTMSTNVHAVRADDPLETALLHMSNHRVRRLPVVDDEDHLVGLLSLSDLAQRAGKGEGRVPSESVLATLAAICAPRAAASSV